MRLVQVTAVLGQPAGLALRLIIVSVTRPMQRYVHIISLLRPVLISGPMLIHAVRPRPTVRRSVILVIFSRMAHVFVILQYLALRLMGVRRIAVGILVDLVLCRLNVAALRMGRRVCVQRALLRIMLPVFRLFRV